MADLIKTKLKFEEEAIVKASVQRKKAEIDVDLRLLQQEVSTSDFDEHCSLPDRNVVVDRTALTSDYLDSILQTAPVYLPTHQPVHISAEAPALALIILQSLS